MVKSIFDVSTLAYWNSWHTIKVCGLALLPQLMYSIIQNFIEQLRTLI